MYLPTIEELGDLRGKKVLVRCDFNTPLEEKNGQFEVRDDFRIRASLPLFQLLQEKGAHVTACTHLGRPDGKMISEFSVEPIRRRLNDLITGVTLLENLRFDPGEESGDEEFGRRLIDGFDFFINEAFGVCHREHASVMIPPRCVPSAAGPHLIAEVSVMLGLLNDPPRPFVAIVGGAKVKDKLAITAKLSEKADAVIVGGGMAFTFWRALGLHIGDSLVDESRIDQCSALLEHGKIHLPVDAIGLPRGAVFGAHSGPDAAESFGEQIPDGFIGLDIGQESIDKFVDIIGGAASVLWNGPMGVFEDARFEHGTHAIASAIAESSATSVIGGGDSAAALAQFGLSNHVSYVSTGGGASLELLEMGDLPGLRALRGGDKLKNG